MSPELSAGAVGFLAAALLTPALERYARFHGLMDTPVERSLHTSPTPRLGGVAVVVAVILGSSSAGAGLAISGPTLVIGCASIAVAAMGLVDDLRGLSPRSKYLVQLAAAIAVAVVLNPDLHVKLPYVGWRVDGLIAISLAALWLTALTNAFNFMDGIDGMTAVSASIVSIFGAALLAPQVGVPLAAVAGSAIGFGLWNLSPATIFIGDSGSLFLGFVIGCLLLVGGGATAGETRVQVLPMMLVVTPYLFDTGYTLLRRALRRENLLEAHRTHLFQRLTIAGHSPRSVTIAYSVGFVLCGLAAWAYLEHGDEVRVILLAAVAGLMAAVVFLTRSAESHR